MNKDYEPTLGYDHKCGQCNVKFFIPAWQEKNWHWRIKQKTFCSYSCMRKWEREHPKKYITVKRD